ncbi:MAG: hypothetical protein E7333_05215 [Clostridiales bacterium]|nr:hypothetical protein [Clostridiales bacterium]
MKEKMVVSSDKLVVGLALALPLLALGLVVSGGLLIFGGPNGPVTSLMVLMVLAGAYLVSIRSYFGTYTFLPADEYHGARIIVEIGNKRYEVAGVPASDFTVGQTALEKWRHVGHVKVKDSMLRLRGVPRLDDVQAFITANFPERKEVREQQAARKAAQEKALSNAKKNKAR